MLSSRINGLLGRISAAKIHSILGCGVVLLLASAPLFSQGSEGRISGTVTDQSGAAIAGAKVIVTDEQRNVPRTLTTDSSGSYAGPQSDPQHLRRACRISGLQELGPQGSCARCSPGPSRGRLASDRRADRNSSCHG